jgi:lipoprotein-anchoring transpeptidase ErfK/SrfK
MTRCSDVARALQRHVKAHTPVTTGPARGKDAATTLAAASGTAMLRVPPMGRLPRLRRVFSCGVAALALGLATPVWAQTATPAPAATASPARAANSTPTSAPTAQPTPTSAPTAQPSPTAAPTLSPSPTATPAPVWVVNFAPADLYVSADASSDSAGSLRPLTYLQVLAYDGGFAQVRNPRTATTAYIDSSLLGPSDPPPGYYTESPPPATESINLPARAVRGAELAFYPTPDQDAQTAALTHNTPVFIADAVTGTDGETWYRTSDGDYLPSDAVRLPQAPSRTFSGRWLDADLNEPAMVTAYDGDQVVWSTLTIKGSPPRVTPTGVFSIIRRVANETMNSDSIGIPRFGPGGYYLTNVLWTQYFTPDGASIHYNYWSSNWGYSASHGCLGMTYADSAYLWNWAGLGTVVSIHY